MNRDKSIFLFDKLKYNKSFIDSLTQKDCEEWIAEEDYLDDYTMLKIDAYMYDSVEEALEDNGFLEMVDSFYMKCFGF